MSLLNTDSGDLRNCVRDTVTMDQAFIGVDDLSILKLYCTDFNDLMVGSFGPIGLDIHNTKKCLIDGSENGAKFIRL